jgi:hypothetical protein
MTAPSDPTALVAELRLALTRDQYCDGTEISHSVASGLLALIAQQTASIEALTKERDEAQAEITLTESLVADERRMRFAAEAERDRLVAEEREACAKLASDLAIAQPVYGAFCAEYCDGHSDGSDAAQAAIAAAVRARAALSTAKERGE